MTISSISRSAGVVSITTSAAHGLIAGQSVNISAVTDTTFNGTYTVATVPSSTTLTVVQPGEPDVTVALTSGVIVAEKEIIVLSTSSIVPGELQIQVLFWYPIASGKELAIKNAVSSFARATGDENAAISAGRLVEDYRTYSVPNTYSGAQVQTLIQLFYTAHLNYFNSQIPSGQYNGFNWNGTSWTQA